MHRNIRRRVFETNSSSTHSISIEDNAASSSSLVASKIPQELYDFMRQYSLNENDVWDYTKKYHDFSKEDLNNLFFLEGGEYDWDNDVLISPDEKLNYVYAHIVSTSEEKRLINDWRFQILKKVIFDYTGLKIAQDIFCDLTKYAFTQFYKEEILYYCKNKNLDDFKYKFEGLYESGMIYNEIFNLQRFIYIDDLSLDLLDSYFTNDEVLTKDKLKELIFNPKYNIIIE